MQDLAIRDELGASGVETVANGLVDESQKHARVDADSMLANIMCTNQLMGRSGEWERIELSHVIALMRPGRRGEDRGDGVSGDSSVS